MKTTQQIGQEIGQAIARDVIADDMPREWTGIDAQDADRIPQGMNHAEVIDAAREAYATAIAAAKSLDYAACLRFISDNSTTPAPRRRHSKGTTQ